MNAALSRALAATATSLLLATTLAACGGDAGTGVATDTGSTTSATPTPSPSATPSVGSYPSYAVQDYAYTLQQQCFCANIDQLYRITVQGGQVTGVAWATAGDGHAVGDVVSDSYLRLTIDDIIDMANNTKAAKVKVDWPAGQDYPDSVYVDQDQRIADEEVTWVISDVEPTA